MDAEHLTGLKTFFVTKLPQKILDNQHQELIGLPFALRIHERFRKEWFEY
jgi:hypothetical protein